MPQIGVDPRLLAKQYNSHTHHNLSVNGVSYTLTTERLQPCVFDNTRGDLIRPVRFQCSYVQALIDGQWFQLKGYGVTKVNIRGFLHNVCIGGPYHELIVDGNASYVPFNGLTHYVTIGNLSISVLKTHIHH